jgi:hypothetical protein
VVDEPEGAVSGRVRRDGAVRSFAAPDGAAGVVTARDGVGRDRGGTARVWLPRLRVAGELIGVGADVEHGGDQRTGAFRGPQGQQVESVSDVDVVVQDAAVGSEQQCAPARIRLRRAVHPRHLPGGGFELLTRDA